MFPFILSLNKRFLIWATFFIEPILRNHHFSVSIPIKTLGPCDDLLLGKKAQLEISSDFVYRHRKTDYITEFYNATTSKKDYN